MENTAAPRRARVRTTAAERSGERVSPSYTAADVLCPYFRRFRPLKICCEGITDDCTLQLSFTCRAALDRQAVIFCAGAWRNCEVARAVGEKYEG